MLHGVLLTTPIYSVDLLKNKMNENGNGKFAAQHFYQVGAGQDASNSDIQSKHSNPEPDISNQC